MSMHPERDDFVQLRRLLALKRHEQPPPGYFNRFSRDVIARIRAGEELRDDSPLTRFLMEFPLLERIWAVLEAKPVIAGAFGAAVCGLLTAGFLMSDTSTLVQTAPVGVLMPENNQLVGLRVASPNPQSVFSQAPGMVLSGTGAVDTIQLRASLFQQPQPQTRLINFSLPAN